MKEIKIVTDFIKLDSFLKLSGAAQTGGHAKLVILDGLVKVNGEVCLTRGKKLHENDTVEFEGKEYLITK